MDLSELSPFPVFVIWEGEAIELKPFSLRSVTWAERFFFNGEGSGFERMNQILSSRGDQNALFNTIIDIVYHLGVEDFESAGVSCPVRLKKLLTENEQSLEILTEFDKALQEVFKNSFSQVVKQPEIKGGKIYENLDKESEPSKSTIEWDQIYVAFYMAGGMSLDEFYNLTMSQVDSLYPEIIYKASEKFSLEAGMHGIKLKNKPRRSEQKEQKPDFSSDDIAGFEKMQKDLMEENKVN